jgi:GNAT superfamily N-acetyltransferase
MYFVHFEPGDPRLIADVLPVLAQLRPHLTPETFDAVCREGSPQGLRFTALYDPEGRCVAVAGWRVMATTVLGRKLYVDDLVTADEARSRGCGHALLEELEGRHAQKTVRRSISIPRPGAPRRTGSTCANA